MVKVNNINDVSKLNLARGVSVASMMRWSLSTRSGLWTSQEFVCML